MSILQENIIVRVLSAEETLDLRSRILRPGQSLDTVRYAEDHLPSTLHLGIVSNGKVICSGTFLAGLNNLFPAAVGAYRLRGMAVETNFQGLGLGSRLLKSAKKNLLDLKCDLLWFNARVSAFSFYEKNGFTRIGDIFEIPGGGPHAVMFKFFEKR